MIMIVLKEEPDSPRFNKLDRAPNGRRRKIGRTTTGLFERNNYR